MGNFIELPAPEDPSTCSAPTFFFINLDVSSPLQISWLFIHHDPPPTHCRLGRCLADNLHNYRCRVALAVSHPSHPGVAGGGPRIMCVT